MNERVRELARRVVGKNKNDVGSISLFDEQIEQFAERLLSEVVGILSHRNEHPVIVHSIKEIKEQFGVEE